MVAKNTGEAPVPDQPETPTEQAETVSLTEQAKLIGKPVYSLMFEPDKRDVILGILAEIKAIGEKVRTDGSKAFDEATKSFKATFDEQCKPFREAYEEACKPFLHLSGDDKAIKALYEALTDVLEINRADMGDVPRYSNLGRPPKKG